mmetsp:Transcript_2770/g.6719  ORF Transcript_2770/g.6719 Transcript_2770/m.6719 type:complete len:385 (+) Transcript_2770:32-1186(+)
MIALRSRLLCRTIRRFFPVGAARCYGGSSSTQVKSPVVVDLRSDTVTVPSTEMREAMLHAEVGDDVYGEDPSVLFLEIKAAELLGMEASVFVPSGTMANLAALLAHCHRGADVILGDKSHIFRFTQGGYSSLGGIHPRVIPNEEDGSLDLKRVEQAIQIDDPHVPATRLLTIENTHNGCGGQVLSAEYTDDVVALCRERGLALHIDGARLLHAAVALGVAPSRLTRGADSVQICLSKGLRAPVGSVLAGSSTFVNTARRWRKALGGGMRQSGFLAAPGLCALETVYPSQLVQDHRNAAALVAGLNDIPWVTVTPNHCQTNIVVFSVDGMSADAVSERLATAGVLVWPLGIDSDTKLRAITHAGVSSDGVNFFLSALKRLCGQRA